MPRSNYPTARAKRIAALEKMRWVVEADADAVGNNAELQQLADKQSGREVVGNRAAAPVEEPPLTQGEMDALAAIGKAMDPEYLLPKTREIAGKLAEAMREGKRAQEEGGEVIANEGPGGKNCRAKSAKTCRCKKNRSYLPKSVQEVASEAEDAFFAALDNETIYSRPDGSEADMDPEFMEEVDTWLKRSYNNLHKDCGLGYNEAKRLHYAAAKKAGELFQKATDSYPEPLHETVEQQEAANKKRKNKKRVKTEIWHYLAPLDVPNATAPVEANITVIKFKGNKGKRIYNCILQKKGSTPRRVALQ